jgi:hypothetical protein
MQMKPYLIGQDVFHFVDGLVLCPSSHVSDSSDGSSSAINRYFLRWKQHDQLILSSLLSSLFMDVLHLVVDCQTSSCVWRTFEKALVSPSNSHIMQLHGSFQDLQQGDALVATYMHHAKSLFDELTAAGRPFSLEDFNLYIFRGLRGEFKDLVTSHVTKTEPLSYANLHNYLLTHEFLHKTSLQSLAVNSPLLPTPSLLPSAHLAQHIITLILAVTEVVFTAIRSPTATGTTTNTSMIFMVLIPLLPRTGSRVIGSNPNDLLLVSSGLLTGPLTRTSSVSYASPSATQPHNMLSFAAVVTSPLPILLLVLFLPLLGSQTLVRTNTLRLILQL